MLSLRQHSMYTSMFRKLCTPRYKVGLNFVGVQSRAKFYETLGYEVVHPLDSQGPYALTGPMAQRDGHRRKAHIAALTKDGIIIK